MGELLVCVCVLVCWSVCACCSGFLLVVVRVLVWVRVLLLCVRLCVMCACVLCVCVRFFLNDPGSLWIFRGNTQSSSHFLQALIGGVVAWETKPRVTSPISRHFTSTSRSLRTNVELVKQGLTELNLPRNFKINPWNVWSTFVMRTRAR